ncbi:hypothetical protein [Chryseobacterium indoltheticum]|uniref:hypothetical protein n=1 Tax=Chryseobacterium indoltheticum TaxID=254 RepID=UPI003F494CAC
MPERETDLFTEEEKVILAMTEEITLISQKGLTDETYEKATQFFDEEQIKYYHGSNYHYVE